MQTFISTLFVLTSIFSIIFIPCFIYLLVSERKHKRKAADAEFLKDSLRFSFEEVLEAAISEMRNQSAVLEERIKEEFRPEFLGDFIDNVPPYYKSRFEVILLPLKEDEGKEIFTEKIAQLNKFYLQCVFYTDFLCFFDKSDVDHMTEAEDFDPEILYGDSSLYSAERIMQALNSNKERES